MDCDCRCCQEISSGWLLLSSQFPSIVSIDIWCRYMWGFRDYSTGTRSCIISEEGIIPRIWHVRQMTNFMTLLEFKTVNCIDFRRSKAGARIAWVLEVLYSERLLVCHSPLLRTATRRGVWVPANINDNTKSHRLSTKSAVSIDRHDRPKCSSDWAEGERTRTRRLLPVVAWRLVIRNTHLIVKKAYR